jgi:hypothetical protein
MVISLKVEKATTDYSPEKRAIIPEGASELKPADGEHHRFLI